MVKTAKKSFFLSLTCALVLLATSVRAEEDSILKAGNKPGTFDFQGTKATRAASDTAAPSEANNGQSLRLMGLWLLLFGAGAGTLVLWYRKRHGLAFPGLTPKPTRKLQIIERIALGHRREVVLIKACDRLLVVASHADQTSLLSDLAADDVGVALPEFENVTDSVKITNDRLLRAEAQMRTQVQKPKVAAPVPQPWPEMEKA